MKKVEKSCGGKCLQAVGLGEARSVIMAAINGPGWISTAGERPSYPARIKHKDNTRYTTKDISRTYNINTKDKGSHKKGECLKAEFKVFSSLALSPTQPGINGADLAVG